MALWQKLNTLFRARANESAQQIVDANAIRIFEQEIRDAQTAIHQAKRLLALHMAEKKKLVKQANQITVNIEVKEKQACEAMDKDAMPLAEEIADIIAEEENVLASLNNQIDYLDSQEIILRKQLRVAIHNTSKYQRELQVAKANRNAQQALGTLRTCSHGVNDSMCDMESSLANIRSKQADFNDFEEALVKVDADFNGDQLDEKLKSVGISTGDSSSQAVLDRLRKQRAA